MAYVEFGNEINAQIIYDYFHSGKSGFSFFSDKFVRVFRGVDHSRLSEEDWSAVVLRNIPPDCGTEKIFSNCSKDGEIVTHVTIPELIKGAFLNNK